MMLGTNQLMSSPLSGLPGNPVATQKQFWMELPSPTSNRLLCKGPTNDRSNQNCFWLFVRLGFQGLIDAWQIRPHHLVVQEVSLPASSSAPLPLEKKASSQPSPQFLATYNLRPPAPYIIYIYVLESKDLCSRSRVPNPKRHLSSTLFSSFEQEKRLIHKSIVYRIHSFASFWN